ncbi:bacterial alpha-L-rhamnosidase-domain-containing protein [Ilyonectria sp. MPI-CAGE-AT-0026]|nr:bacterial alpha-L-rhamnosidase-domain-containing protein [Ilyonectria sp. MPI-CAGE-AT-0026]
MSATFDRTWIWHPSYPEHEPNTAGLFVHFKRQFSLGAHELPKSLKIHITADTKYKLYVNRRLVSFGPVKGDHNLWFYDEVDIAPYLVEGINCVGVHILRFFYSTQFATSFPRLATGGLRIVVPDSPGPWSELLSSSPLWETAIDPFGRLRVDEPEDCFLHVYEVHSRVETGRSLEWVPAKVLEFKNSTGNSPPWHLSPRLIPTYRIQKATFSAIHHLQSDVQVEHWNKLLLAGDGNAKPPGELRLAPGCYHQFELEAAHHMTAFIRVLFKRPSEGGGYVKLTYAESYEDEPDLYKGERRKAHRRDLTKRLMGPHDLYHLQGTTDFNGPGYYDEEMEERFVPFHFRTFRFIKVEIYAGATELVFCGLEMESAHYPLDVRASVSAPDELGQADGDGVIVDQLWATSLRTLINCMHDCYEDCPFYEQLQYAMDTRSSTLFTYCISHDDLLARQAIIQIYNSFQPRMSLTASRAPTHRQQFIPTFSLYWICMLSDHYVYFGDKLFLSRFLVVVDGVLAYFESRIDTKLGLVKTEFGPGSGVWNFVDWTQEWKPYGYPAICESTGFSTFTNEIYAYTLKLAAEMVSALGRPAIADEYQERAARVVAALQQHCFDGEFFTDSILSAQQPLGTIVTHSQHSQTWAVLSGASSGAEAQELLRKSMERTRAGKFVQESISMSFYTMRALSLAGGDLYDKHFHAFWKPWLDQLDLGVTTWVEDSVAQRSDCHAWGSVSLYEFTAEVAGVRPAAPGWKAIGVKPRLRLYPSFNASVPLSVVDRGPIGIVHISWTTCLTTGDVKLCVSGDMDIVEPVPLCIQLPGYEINLAWAGQKLDLTVKG